MKFWKGFSFFFIYPFTMMLLGFLGGILLVGYFFPNVIRPEGVSQETQEPEGAYGDWQKVSGVVGTGIQSGEELASGQIFGEVSGQIPGEGSGEIPGGISGEISGEIPGGISGEGSWEIPGEISGEGSGKIPGEMSGNISGGTPGQISGEISGEVPGKLSGQISEGISGEGSGEITGELSGILPDEISGEMEGQTSVGQGQREAGAFDLGTGTVRDSGSSSGREGLKDTSGEGSGFLGSGLANAEPTDPDSQAASFFGEKLNADTAYVLEETDLQDQSVVETTWKLPEKYIGMNREEFLRAMDNYELAPPLNELERGFVSLEVLSFSPEKVVVKMNYDYVRPGNSFYLAVEDNYVVVYLEDKKTVYMYTDILLNELPDAVQQDIIHWMYMPDEESLYNFLEGYSS